MEEIMNWINTQNTQYVNKTVVYRKCMDTRQETALASYLRDKKNGVTIL